MDDGKLGKAALLCALLGLVAILLFAEESSEKESKNSKLTKEQIGEEIVVEGIIKTVKDTPTVTIINVQSKKNEYIVIAFKNKDSVLVKKEDAVRVEGVIKEYQGSLEIEAKKISVF